MKKGELRREILDQCPEDFEDILKDWIDGIESNFKNILSALDDVRGLVDLHKIEDARNELAEMCDGLY